MSDYWKKKLDELNGETKKPTSQSYWDRKLYELEEEEKQHKKIVSELSKKKDNDIAPVKKKDEDEGLDFFQKSGLFDDGYDFGDITKTILGTVGDAGLNIVKGAAGLGEGLVDLAGYGVAGVAEFSSKLTGTGAGEAVADDLRKKLSVDYIDKKLKPAEEKLDKYSVLGRTSDSIMQGVGQVGTILLTGGIAAGAGVSATAATTGVMGLSGMGSGMGQAYQSGATDGEATAYGAISGAADALTELMFGGLGKAVKATGLSHGAFGLDDMLAKKVSNMFSSQLMKNAAEFGVKASGEGIEEVVAGVAQAIGKKLTYMDEKELGDLLKDENLLEQFVVGAVTSGITQAPSVVQSTKSGTDFVTGLNQDEQAVIKKEVENRIAEQEKGGRKLTKQEKAAIEEQVARDLDKGHISTDLIDEIVGGDTYKAYKDSVKNRDAVLAEFEELGKTQNATLAQQSRYRELETRVKDIRGSDLWDKRKAEVDGIIAKRVNGTRLAESYNERARRGQVFTADVTKYDEKQRETVQRAIDSGVMNNTNRAHELVDTMAKISADKGVTFDFTNTAKMREAGMVEEGVVKNGYITSDGKITINVDSAKALQSIAGHEVTHALEQSEHYQELQNAVFTYAQYKGDYNSRLKSITDLYAKYDPDADPKKELTADLVGDYLFTDEKFVNKLAVENRNLFQKIWDEVKYLWKVATAGSKEARQLEKVKHAFEKAYRDSGKQSEAQSNEVSSEETDDVQYSISVDDKENLDTIKEKYKDKTDYLFLHEKKDGTISIDNMVVKQEFRDQGIGTQILNDVIAYADKEGKTVVLTPTTEYGTKARLTKWYKSHGFVENKGKNADYRLSDTMYRLPRDVKYSLSADTDGRQLSNEQREYFKDSKVVDENGNLKVMYHGTSAGGHTVFDPYGKARYGLFGAGSYFTDNKDVAESYTNKGKGNNKQVYETYLNITNPMDMDAAADAEAWAKAMPDVRFPEVGTNEAFYRAMEEYFEDAEYARWEAAETAMEVIEGMGYDGITHIGGGRFNKADPTRHRVYIAFQPEQIKNVDNTKPTDNPDIRYSLSTDNEGKQLTKEQAEYFKDSKMRDRRGNLKVMYHGTTNGGFHTFDNRYSDDGASFFFVDDNLVASTYSGTRETYAAQAFNSVEDLNNFFKRIGKAEYFVDEKDGKYRLRQDEISSYYTVAESDSLDDLYNEFCDYEGVGYGDVNYKVYLNLVNPFIFDAKGAEWNGLPNIKGNDTKYEYIKLVSVNDDNTVTIEYTLTGDPAPVTKDVVLFDGFEFDDGVSETLANMEPDEIIENVPAHPSTTREYAEYARKNGYDGVIFENINDNGGYGHYGTATVAIAFDSNQIKSVANTSPTAAADIRYSMSGINAETANSSMLVRAEHMLNAGADSEFVRKETGWFKGYDGKWRFEIDDSKSKLIDNPNLEKHDRDGATYFTGKISDILDHSDLYEAYPQLRNVNIIVQETATGTRGIYQPNSNYITLSMELFKRNTKEYEAYLNGDRKAEIERIEQTPEYKEYSKWYEDEELSEKLSPEKWLEEEKKARDAFFNSELGKRYYQLKWGKVNIQKSEFGWGKEAKEVLMHEIQHAIQKIERFASGSSPEYWKRVLAAGETIQTAEQKAELREAENKLYKVYAQNPDFYNEMTELLYNTPKMPRGKVNWETLEQIEEDPIEWQEFDKKRDALEEKYGALEVWDFMDIYHNVERYSKRSLTADDAYYSTAGEIEARDTANRLNLTADERRSKRPAIDHKGVVFTDRYSLSAEDEQPKTYGSYNIFGRDVAYAPVREEAQQNNVPKATPTELPIADDEDFAPTFEDEETGLPVKATPVEELFPDDMAPVSEEYEADRMDSLFYEEAPPEMDEQYSEDEPVEPMEDPFYDRDIYEIGNRKIKAYQYENPDVRPYFRKAAESMLGDLRETVKGEKWFNSHVYYESGGEEGFGGTSRQTAPDIAELLDKFGYTYAQIEKGLNDIIEDNGKENNAVAKRIEFMLNDRLLYGYKDVWEQPMPPDAGYIQLVNEKSITEYSKEAFAALDDRYAPPVEEDIAPVAAEPTVTKALSAQRPVATLVEDIAPVAEEYEAITPEKPKKQKRGDKLVRVDSTEQEEQQIAKILEAEPTPANRKNRAWARFKAAVLDKGAVFEDLALKTRNRELMGKWNYIISSEARAQRLMGSGNDKVKSLNSIREKVETSGNAKEFYEYLYHKHNVDRMNLEDRYEDTPNKPVFGWSVTSEVSQGIVEQYEKTHPQFVETAQDVYDYMNYLRTMMVENGVISQDTADLWAEMYPHYVPIRRAVDKGLAINVPLDTGRTGVNAPVKRATGGSSDILPLFDTMAMRTLQTYRAVARNSFGVELKNTLRSNAASEATNLDEIIDSIDDQEGLLQAAKNGMPPTFTVFENGEKVTYNITEDMYDALKPVSEFFSGTSKVLNTISNFRRGVLTEFNPVFMLTNAIKDVQDIVINSQHPVRTYAKIPEAAKQMKSKGYWYKEYMENGGEQNTYFDRETNTFDAKRKGAAKLLDIPPLSTISKLNNIIEMTPRLAEYIASREAGRSVEVSMLDAARVTTNFAAGGDVTKWLNRNGATFLNASVQGLTQNVRNFREAKANGLKGWANLATKFVVAGLPAVLLNNLIWDDDDEYEELSDYVKNSYYIVWKTEDGKFIRIPKGRTLAVIQNGFEQMENLITGDDEADLGTFLELVVSNLAPNNPLDENIASPIVDVLTNETWYGEDLVPTRLQKLPAAEQFDESTDSFSRWLGDKLNVSPVKINYLLDQYSGGVGDVFLPMMTPEAESGNNTFVGNMLAPLKSKFTADAVMNNQNVSDFYELKDELSVNANAGGATDEDVLKYKYMNSVSAEMSELYAQKREIQSSDLPDDKKYELVREVQRQIGELAKNALETYNSISISGEYATVGDRYFNADENGEWKKLTDEQVTKYEATRAAGDSPYASDGTNHYRMTDDGWRKITDDQLKKQNEVTSGLGISAEDYWGNKEEYDYAYEHPENYAVAKAVGGYEAYKAYSGELYDIKADKDEYGKSISGSRKEKVLEYINNLDADYYTKIILWKNEYNSDDTYNYEIIEYLDSRSDISYEEELAILRKLGFMVDAEGNVYCD